MSEAGYCILGVVAILGIVVIFIIAILKGLTPSLEVSQGSMKLKSK